MGHAAGDPPTDGRPHRHLLAPQAGSADASSESSGSGSEGASNDPLGLGLDGLDVRVKGQGGTAAAARRSKFGALWRGCLCCYMMSEYGAPSAQGEAEGGETGEAGGGFSKADLVGIDSVPSYVRRDFILWGYRRKMGWRDAWRSLSYVHNETGNVLTHALGLAVFLGMALHFASTRPGAMPPAEALLLSLFILGCSSTLLFSAAYHLFMCVGNRRTYDRLLACDLSGIVASILTSFYIALWTTFRCEPTLRMSYCVMITAVCVWLGTVVAVPALRDSHWVVLLSFVGAVGSGIFPVAHYTIRNWEFGVTSDPNGKRLVIGVLCNIASYMVGVVFYMTAWPERQFPGAFDNWLHSHQLWHIFVFLGPIFMLVAVEGTVGRTGDAGTEVAVCCAADGPTFPTSDQCALQNLTRALLPPPLGLEF